MRRALLVCTAASLCWGCNAPARPPNLVLIIVDTLRADRLGAWGYPRPTSPAVDALAADGIRFERAYATAPWTKPSVASMLTGLLPSNHGIGKLDSVLPEEADTLAEILSRMGYATGAVVSHTLIGAQFGFGQGFALFDQSEARGHRHVSTPGITKVALSMLDELADEERPLFLLVHYFDPHFDYRRHPEYGFSSDGAGRLRGNQRIRQLRRMNPQPDDEEMAYLRDVYDEEIRFTDEGIGELIAGLRERNLYDSSVIVLTADHGEEFNEHGWLGHTRNLYEGLIHVPLIFRLPGGEWRGRVIAEPVSLLALAPTVLDAMGFDASDLDFQHGSLIPMLRREETADPIFVYSEVDFVAGHRPESRSTSMRSVIRGRHKLIHNRNTDRYELYDVLADPSEIRDLAAAEPDLLRSLRRDLDVVRERAQGGVAHRVSRRALESDERAALRELGYIED